MDCLKNLTACMGCTKKHAKCSWRDVRESELRENDLRDGDIRDIGIDEVLDRANSRHESYGAVESHEPAPHAVEDVLHPPIESDPTKERSLTPEKRNGSSGHESQSNATPAAAPSPPRPVEETKLEQLVPSTAPAAAPAELDSVSRSIENQLQEAAIDVPFRRIPRVEPAARPRYQIEDDDDDDDDDEGDRLQAAAAQVYRSASQQGQRAKA